MNQHHSVDLCPICRYQHAVPNASSLLGTQGACFECLDAKAETPLSIHNALQEAEALPYGDTGRLMIKFILKRATCWAGCEVGYMDLVAYEERVTKQMPVAITEDEILARRMRERIQHVNRHKPIVPLQKPDLLERVIAWFKSLPGTFHNAVDAGI